MTLNHAAWARLQDLLETLKPGDEVQVSSVAASTGLDPEACVMVFAALARADLFTQKADDMFVRRRISFAADEVTRSADEVSD